MRFEPLQARQGLNDSHCDAVIPIRWLLEFAVEVRFSLPFSSCETRNTKHETRNTKHETRNTLSRYHVTRYTLHVTTLYRAENCSAAPA